MRIPSVGWAFFGLAVLVLIGYVLNRGLLIGGNVRMETRLQGSGQMYDAYHKYCSYLHFGGVKEVWSDSSKRIEEVEAHVCSMFDQ